MEAATEILITYDENKDQKSSDGEKCAQTVESGNLEKLLPEDPPSLTFLENSDAGSLSEPPSEQTELTSVCSV